MYLAHFTNRTSIFIDADSLEDLLYKLEKLGLKLYSYDIIRNDHWYICKCIKSMNNFYDGSKYIYAYSDHEIEVFFDENKSIRYSNPNEFLKYFKHINESFIR